MHYSNTDYAMIMENTSQLLRKKPNEKTFESVRSFENI